MRNHVKVAIWALCLLGIAACGQASDGLAPAPPPPPPPAIPEPEPEPEPTPIPLSPPPPQQTPTQPPEPEVEEPAQAVACGEVLGDVCTADADGVMDFNCVFDSGFPNLSERWHRIGIDLTDTVSLRLDTSTIGTDSRAGRVWLLPDPNCFSEGPTAPLVTMAISTTPNDFEPSDSQCYSEPDWNALINWTLDDGFPNDCILDDDTVYYINIGVMNCPGGRCTQTLIIADG